MRSSFGSALATLGNPQQGNATVVRKGWAKRRRWVSAFSSVGWSRWGVLLSAARKRRPLWKPLRISKISAVGQAVAVHVTECVWAGVWQHVSS